MELPEDVMAEILSSLDLKTLLRFKCVCRQWCTLISSRSFAYLQQSQSLSNPTILVQESHKSQSRILQLLDPISFAPVEKSILELDSFTKPIFVGSINGLVCLETYFQGPSAVVILNPSTGFFKGITTRVLQPEVHHRTGFGWDPTADDYKVFRLCTNFDFDRELGSSWVEVWSSNLQYWRMYEVDCNIRPWVSNCENLIMEGFTYILIRQQTDLIACFDVKKEVVVRFIPIPQLLLDLSGLFLMNWKGTLAVAALVESTCKEYQVWTMDDDISECWSKKFTFEPIENIEFWSYYYSFSTFINGTQVLLRIPGDELILYDLETRESRKIKSSSLSVIMSAYYHVETLLSIP